jgi:hypothetical protein
MVEDRIFVNNRECAYTDVLALPADHFARCAELTRGVNITRGANTCRDNRDNHVCFGLKSGSPAPPGTPPPPTRTHTQTKVTPLLKVHVVVVWGGY